MKQRVVERKMIVQKSVIQNNHQKTVLVTMKMKISVNFVITAWPENELTGKGVDCAKSCLTVKNSSIFIQNFNTKITNMSAVMKSAHICQLPKLM